MRACGIEQVRPWAETRVQLDDAGLAQRIDGRIGDLGEALAEIVIDGARRARERGNGRVVAHRPDGVLAIGGHWLQDHAHVFARVAEEPLQLPAARSAGRPLFHPAASVSARSETSVSYSTSRSKRARISRVFSTS